LIGYAVVMLFHLSLHRLASIHIDSTCVVWFALVVHHFFHCHRLSDTELSSRQSLPEDISIAKKLPQLFS
jgi:hypothetical protein